MIKLNFGDMLLETFPDFALGRISARPAKVAQSFNLLLKFSKRAKLQVSTSERLTQPRSSTGDKPVLAAVLGRY